MSDESVQAERLTIPVHEAGRIRPMFQVVHRDLATGQFTTKSEDTEMTGFNPEDAATVSKFFSTIADRIILSSQLAKDVEELRHEVQMLKTDVEHYRENNARLDEEVNRLRQERNALQENNGELQHNVDVLKTNLANVEDARAHHERASTDWQNRFIETSQAHHQTKADLENANYHVMELEDKLRSVEAERDLFRQSAERNAELVRSIKERLEGHTIVATDVHPVPQIAPPHSDAA